MSGSRITIILNDKSDRTVPLPGVKILSYVESILNDDRNPPQVRCHGKFGLKLATGYARQTTRYMLNIVTSSSVLATGILSIIFNDIVLNDYSKVNVT